MIFPIGDDQVKGGYAVLLTYLFLGLNILIFLYEFTLPQQEYVAFINTYGSIPVEILRGEDYFTLFTSMFLHGGWMHLIGNMLFLWIFADNIEASVGGFKFLIFYILGGLAAHAAHIYFNPASQVPTVGASGAISAVLGAYLVMFPQSRVRVLSLIFIITTFKVPAILFLGFWIFQQLISGIGSLEAATAQTAGVAWWAHIGGFAFGLVAGLFFRVGSVRGQIR